MAMTEERARTQRAAYNIVLQLIKAGATIDVIKNKLEEDVKTLTDYLKINNFEA